MYFGVFKNISYIKSSRCFKKIPKNMAVFKLENFDEDKKIKKATNFFLFLICLKFNKESENDGYIFVNHI